VTPVTVTLLMLVLWMNVSTFFAIDTDGSLPMWERVMKIQLMTFVILYLLHGKQQINILLWVITLSVGFFGVKGGLFTMREGGELRVWGPPGSFIEDNNSLALATIMTIPLLFYLYQQSSNRWVRRGLVAAALLCGLSVLGSYSRGGLIAIVAMLAFLWSRSRSRVATGLVLLMLVPVAIGFMPDKWEDRMWSIMSYEEDSSSMGRINAWKTTINLANDRPLIGGGFDIYTEQVFERYAPVPEDLHAAHSIYFQMLGEHGYVGLALFLLLWYLSWKNASWIVRRTRDLKEMRWAFDLAHMIQVSFVGYAVGGAFLSLAYYDVPYYLLAALVLIRREVEQELGDRAARASPPAPELASADPGERGVVARTRLDPQMEHDKPR
jgi:probable O-glycosylation ligase (exosortase A-associated)